MAALVGGRPGGTSVSGTCSPSLRLSDLRNRRIGVVYASLPPTTTVVYQSHYPTSQGVLVLSSRVFLLCCFALCRCTISDSQKAGEKGRRADLRLYRALSYIPRISTYSTHGRLISTYPDGRPYTAQADSGPYGTSPHVVQGGASSLLAVPQDLTGCVACVSESCLRKP